MSKRPFFVMLAMTAIVISLHGPVYAARDRTPGPGDTSFNPAADTEGNHCTNPNGVDLNEAYGISEQIVTGGCRIVEAGEFYTRTLGWFTESSWQAVPEGYVPAAATPMEDFLAKVTAVVQVLDPGTPTERTYRFARTSSFILITRADVDPSLGSGEGADPLAVSIGRLPPAPKGSHVIVTTLVMGAQHCDGAGTDPVEHCLEAGETLFSRTTFTVQAV